jgi:two-component system CheB/CheR fusion protein
MITEKIKKPFYIAGIGSSAGGLEALQDFLSHLPENLKNVAFIVAQHLSPTHKSMLVQLLSRETKLLVSEAKNGDTVEPNNIYITPPDNEISISGGKIWLQRPKGGIGPKPSVDILFQSLAEDIKENAIGIILSGTGSDGAIGVRHIKSTGGFVIVQEPQTAKYNGMPLASIETGLVDMVLAPDKMGEELSEITQNESYPRDLQLSAIENDSDSLESIFKLLSRRTGTDFANYKPSTIGRRLQKRLSSLKVNSIEDYLTYIEKNPQELDSLFNMILIGVTSFFRDANAFSEFEKVLLKIINSKAEGEPIRIWAPGCATGEEAYSLAILLSKNLKEKISDYNVQIFATDIDEKAITIARKGIYSTESLKEVPDDLVNQFFLKKGNQFELLKSVRSLVLFSKHDLTSNPPFLKLDLICCRNLLIYFGSFLQKQIIPLFHYALKPNGYLFLGKSETVGQYTDLFNTEDGKSKIFQRKRGGKLHSVQFSTFRPTSKIFPTQAIGPKQKGEQSLSDVIKETIFNTFESPYLLVNDTLDIQEISGDVGLYISIAEGAMNANIFKLVNKDLLIELRSILTKAVRDRIQQRSGILKFNFYGAIHYVRIKIKPLLFSETTKDLFLVIFEKQDPEDFAPIITLSETIREENPRILELEHELNATKEHLQTYIEELETSNEELQSLNEEMQSTNEELQSSNEELETSNEELQSTNEEIQIAYSELKAVNEELEEKDRLLINLKANERALLDNTLQSFFLVDKSYRIITFNQKATDTINQLYGKTLKAGDSIFDLISSKNLESFRGNFSEALKGTSTTGEQKILQPNGSFASYLYNLTPAIREGSFIENVSMSLLDITHLRNLQTELNTSEKLLASVFETNSIGISITDKNGYFVNVNQGYCDLYGYTREELIGFHFTKVVPKAFKERLTSLHDLFIEGKEELAAEWTAQRKDGSLIDIFASASLLVQGDGTRYKITSVRDITENKKYKNLLEETQESASVGGWQFDSITNELSWTEETFKVFGLDSSFQLSLESMSKLFEDEAKIIFQNSIAKTLTLGEAFDLELQTVTRNNTNLWIRATCKPISVYDKVIKLFGTFQNITSLKESALKLKESEDLFRSIYENIKDGIFISYPNGEIIKTNYAASEIFGYTESEFLSLSLQSLFAISEKQMYDSMDSLKQNGTFQAESKSIHKNGNHFPCEVYSSTFKLANGEDRVCTIIRDLSERNQMINIQARLKNALYFSNIVALTDNDGLIIETNDNFSRLSEFSKEELIDIKYNLLDPKFNNPDSLEKLWNGINSGNIWRGEILNQTKTGKTFWLDTSIFPLKDSSGKEQGFMAVCSEITERKQKEIEKERLLTSLAQRNKDLEQFSYIVSHNLRAPLANILGLSNLLKDTNIENETTNLIISNLYKASQNLDTVITDLSEILQIRKRVREEKQQVKLSSLIDSIIMSIDNTIQETKANIDVDFSEIDEILTLKGYMHSIFTNLITNSIQYARVGIAPFISIQSKKIGHNIQIVVKDNGRGIDLKKYSDKIFGLYKRFHLDVEGKGVGLYMTKTQVELLGGTIKVESEVQKGTTFTIELPLN